MNNAPLASSVAHTLALLLALGATGCATARAPRLAEPVSVEGDAHVAVRVEAGSLWAGARAHTEPRRVWRMPACGPVEELTVRALPGSGFEITFRQGGGMWRGELDTDRAARGPLRAMGWSLDGAARDEVAARP